MAQIGALSYIAVAALLAAVIGYVNQHGGTCTVAAINDLVRRKPDRIIAIGEAGLWACAVGVVLRRAGWALPLAVDWPVTMHTIAGGALLGFGAWLNKACLFGTLTQLGRRNLNYVFTLIGLLAGFALHAAWFTVPPSNLGPSRAGQAVMLAVAMLFTVSLLGHAARTAVRTRRDNKMHLQWFGHREALIVHAAAFTVMAGMIGPWTYGDVLSRYVHNGEMPDQLHLLLVFALISGALVSGWQAGPQPKISMRAAAGCLTGGAMMALGSGLVPGGNDALFLYGAPSLQFNAVVAIVVMVAVLVFCILFRGIVMLHKLAPIVTRLI